MVRSHLPAPSAFRIPGGRGTRGQEKEPMPKTTKIDVLTVKLTVHIPHELGDALSLHRATDAIEGLCRYAADLGETAIDVRVNRVRPRAGAGSIEARTGWRRSRHPGQSAPRAQAR